MKKRWILYTYTGNDCNWDEIRNGYIVDLRDMKWFDNNEIIDEKIIGSSDIGYIIEEDQIGGDVCWLEEVRGEYEVFQYYNRHTKPYLLNTNS